MLPNQYTIDGFNYWSWDDLVNYVDGEYTIKKAFRIQNKNTAKHFVLLLEPV